MTNAVNNTMVVDCLRDLSDPDFQNRVWIRGEGPEVSSFVETVCELFDDSGLGTALEKGTCVYDEDIDSKLNKLSEMLDDIDTQEDIKRVVTSKKWTRIIKLSGELRTMILTIKK